MARRDRIVMIHGMWGYSRVWDFYKRFFETKGYSCETPVLRFHDLDPQSESNPELGKTSLLDYAHDLEQTLAHASPKPIIIGHSMGCLLALMLAARQLAKAIVLLAPAPPAGLVVFNASVAKCFRSEIRTWGFWRKPVRQTFEDAAYALFHLMPAEKQKSLYARCVYESGRATFEILFW